MVANVLASRDIYQENGQIVYNVALLDYPNLYYLRKMSFSYSRRKSFRKVLLLLTVLEVVFLSVFIQMSNSSFIPSPPFGQRRVLVPEAAVVQASPAHYVSPLIHDKPIQEPSHSDMGVSDTAEDDQQSAVKQRLPCKYRASPTSRYPDKADPLSTTTTDVPSTSVSCPLPVSPAQGTSYVDVKNRPLSTQFTDHNSPLAMALKAKDIRNPAELFETDIIIAYGLSQIHQYVADDGYRFMGPTGSGKSNVRRDISYIGFIFYLVYRS